MRTTLLLLALTCACAELRASSRDHLDETASQRTFAAPPAAVAAVLHRQMERRGFALTARADRPDSVVYRYGGRTGTQTSMNRTGNRTEIEVQEVGAAFYATLEQAPGGGTRVHLLGKPIWLKGEVCTDHDPAGFPCEPHSRGALGPDGREEASIIHTVWLDLEKELGGTR